MSCLWETLSSRLESVVLFQLLDQLVHFFDARLVSEVRIEQSTLTLLVESQKVYLFATVELVVLEVGLTLKDLRSQLKHLRLALLVVLVHVIPIEHDELVLRRLSTLENLAGETPSHSRVLGSLLFELQISVAGVLPHYWLLQLLLLQHG